MADAVTVQSLVDYYVNLLIIQYHEKPKAKATIALLVESLIANGIVLDVQNGYSIDTAVGAQLDIIGKYVGVDRFYKDQNLINYFALTGYTEVNPDALEKWGFTTYANFDSLVENGTITYNSVLSSDFKLNDDDYRTLIKLKIAQNTSNHSHKQIDDDLFRIFGTEVRADSTGDMHMIYFVPENMTEIVRAAISKQVMPRPMGVGLLYIPQGAPFFGYATYGITSPFITGFTTYALYASKEGEMLNYDKLSGEI